MSTQAKYYIYRNLHKQTFSVRYKGKVIAHHDNIIASGVQFRVSEVVRQKVLREKKKYVHAYVVCDSYKVGDSVLEDMTQQAIYTEVKYNPYQQSTFTHKGEPIERTTAAWLTRGKVFI